MADEFDPLKETNNVTTEDLYATITRTPLANDDDLLRSPFEDILKLANKPEVTKPEETKPESTYERLDFTSTAYKTPTRSTNPFDTHVQPTPVIRSHSENESATSDQQYWDRTEQYRNQNYEPGPPPAYYPEEYYEEERTSKRRGFSAAVDRLVQRIPILNIFYKQSPQSQVEHQPEYYVEEIQQEEEEEIDDVPQLIGANIASRELTADELGLNERYSNKSRTQIISLQNKNETQPIDVSLHHDSYTIYLCDVGRNILEVFDMNGKLQHVIDDQITQKFQATSIAVAYDGTIIAASHFNHRLHMYSPDIEEAYHYKQYKLGAPGHNIHEFYYPAGITIDYHDGYLYICDRGNFRIKVLRPEGVCERVIDLISYDEKQTPVAPIQIAHQRTADQLVCLVDKGEAICFVTKNSDGPTYIDPLYIIDTEGVGLQGASGIAIDNEDRIFISDTGHHRIVICTSDGSYITHFGMEGTGPGELKRPCGLDITNDGTLIVADSGNKRIQFFGSIREQITEENKADNKNILLVDTEKPAV